MSDNKHSSSKYKLNNSFQYEIKLLTFKLPV